MGFADPRGAKQQQIVPPFDPGDILRERENRYRIEGGTLREIKV
jgi:hypothetical protein